jgi:[ribosomal protein S5]-alanine N-acetyltransferase
MSKNSPVILETARLLIREFKKDDWRAAHEYGSDPDVVKYVLFGPNTEKDTRNFVQKVIECQKVQPRVLFSLALEVKTTNQMIGSCEIKITDAPNQTGEIGYILNRNYWNQGYISEAARAVVSFGFEKLRLHRIYATCDPANTGSYRVMEKIGMKREGYLRECKLIKGSWRDCLIYSILE